MRSSQSPTHQSLERGLRVIEATAAVGGSATLAEIARKTALRRKRRAVSSRPRPRIIG